MRLRLTPRATRDVAEIADYIGARNPAAAQRVSAAISESLQDIVAFPYIGRKQNVENVRKLVARKYPYLIYYTVEEAVDESSPYNMLPADANIPTPNLYAQEAKRIEGMR